MAARRHSADLSSTNRARHDGPLTPALEPRQIPLGLDLPPDRVGHREPSHAQHGQDVVRSRLVAALGAGLGPGVFPGL
jgi:hypothetical protein